MEWNKFLQERDCFPRTVGEGPRKYVNYPSRRCCCEGRTKTGWSVCSPTANTKVTWIPKRLALNCSRNPMGSRSICAAFLKRRPPNDEPQCRKQSMSAMRRGGKIPMRSRRDLGCSDEKSATWALPN